jgi:hypothetical protein
MQRRQPSLPRPSTPTALGTPDSGHVRGHDTSAGREPEADLQRGRWTAGRLAAPAAGLSAASSGAVIAANTRTFGDSPTRRS